MVTRSSTNPFDDDHHHYHHVGVTTTMTRTTTNPFDHPSSSNATLLQQQQQQQQQQHRKYPATSSNPLDNDDDDDDNGDEALLPPPPPIVNLNDSFKILPSTATTVATATPAAPAPAPAAEASWQYLGDLPYRRIEIYKNVCWTSKDDAMTTTTGLAQFPASLFTTITNNTNNTNSSSLLDAREMRQWILTCTVTQVVGCPHGGPIAAVTLPLHTRSTTANATSITTAQHQQQQQRFTFTEVRILSNSGQLLAKIPFPQQQQQQQQKAMESGNSSNATNITANTITATGNVTGGATAAATGTTGMGATATATASSQSTPQPQPQPQQPFSLPPQFQRGAADIFKIGFTERGILVVLMRDSLCFTYDIGGDPVLPPFFLLTNTTTTTTGGGGGGGATIELVRAHIFGQGVACLASNNKQVAVCEFLHEIQDASYLQGAHVTAREVRAVTTAFSQPQPQDPSSFNTKGYSAGAASFSVASSTMVALVTPLSVASEWCVSHFKNFRTVAVLPRHCTSHGRPEVFLSTDDHSVVIIQVSARMELIDVDCRNRLASPIVDMSFCPNGRFLACFTEASMLTVMSTTFETKVLDFDTSEGSSLPPSSICWVGEDAVVLHWKNMGLLMVGPYGDWLRFPYSSTTAVHLIPEMDSCRVITDSTVELLQRVPPMTANLLRIGSIEGAALLLEAADAFGAGSVVSDDVLLMDDNNPPKEHDIRVCIGAATKEFDIATQKRLLRAASYGMQYLKQKQASSADHSDNNNNNNNNTNNNARLVMGGPLDLDNQYLHEDEDWNSDVNHNETAAVGGVVVLPSITTRQFVAAARKLRILNALRNPQVGFILTAAQYDALSPTGVLGRLISMQRPALASRLAVYLRLPKAVQLYARASKAAAYVQKVHSSLGTAEAQSDSIVAEKAIAIIQNEDDGNGNDKDDNNDEPEDELKQEKFFAKNKNNSSIFRGAYATVAMAATKAGRPGVANHLLMLESSVSDKVPALISNGSHVQAMAVATQAHDGDYIFSTLMELEKYNLALANNASEISKAQTKFWQIVINKLPLEAFHTLRRYYSATTTTSVVTAGEGAGGGAGGALGLFLRAQRHTDAGITLAKRALAEQDPREQHGILQEASQVFSLGKETTFYKICTDDYMELTNYQELLRTKYGSWEVAPHSTSVTATLVSVLNYAATHVREQHRLLGDADRIAKKFRIPDRRLWHVKVKAFSESGQWSNLRLLADSRSKSPIGYAPFARAAIRGRQSATEIIKYIDKITAAEERCDLLAEAGMWKRALEEAIKIRDLQRILNVKARCNSPELQMQAEQALGKLS